MGRTDARETRSTSAISPASSWLAARRRPLGQPYYVTLATKAAILGMAGVGLNLALGYGGLVSFGHAAFFGIGGYAAGILASPPRTTSPC